MQQHQRKSIAARALIGACGGLAGAILATAAHAHFGMVIPSTGMVTDEKTREVKVDFAFAHPFEREGMVLARPAKIGVKGPGGEVDLNPQLKPLTLFGKPGFTVYYKLPKPGTYAFFMQPQPYWEPAEDKFIVHYTKTYVSAFGNDEGWDEEVGLPTEIQPLSKPFGLYAGNVFQGIVKVDGKPAPFSEVEVEYYNQGIKPISAPNPGMATQTIKADANGVFTYAPPGPGWWGFAALNKADYEIEHEGQKKEVELGAVLWVHFERWPGR